MGWGRAFHLHQPGPRKNVFTGASVAMSGNVGQIPAMRGLIWMVALIETAYIKSNGCDIEGFVVEKRVRHEAPHRARKKSSSALVGPRALECSPHNSQRISG